ncbi:MAG: FAD-binding oxidoreductase [Candidatus Paceibacterota bacterium]
MFKEEIKSLIKGDVENTKNVLEKYSHDYSVFEVIPEVIVFPKDVEDVKALVRFVNKKRSEGYFYVSLTPRGAGTCMSGGSLNTSIIMDMTRYMKGTLEVKKINDISQKPLIGGRSYKISGEARVLPGTFYRDFEKETLKEGLIMPCYPASKNLCAVGGMVANNGAGEKSLKYGQNKDFVKSLKVVLDDGEEYEISQITKEQLEAKSLEENSLGRICRRIWNILKRNEDEIRKARPKTSKNSSGYLIWDVWDEDKNIFDLTKLFVGAQGSTGIITEITYKLVSVEDRSKLLVVFLKDLNQIPELTKELLKFDLESLEVYDDHTIKFAVKFFWSFIKDKGIKGVFRYMVNFFPEFLMVLRGGMPKLIVLAEFVSNDKFEIEEEAKSAQRNISHLGLRTRVIKTDEERNKYFDIRRDSFKLLSDHSKGTKTAPFIDDISIPPENLPLYLPELTKILDREKLLYTIAGHLGNGNLHIIPLMNFEDPKTEEIILRISPEVYALVKKHNGTITAEHNDGIIRTPFLPIMFGEKVCEIFAEIKEIFDPKNIFNPGKKVGGTIEDIEKYIIKPKKV